MKDKGTTVWLLPGSVITRRIARPTPLRERRGVALVMFMVAMMGSSPAAQGAWSRFGKASAS